MVKEFGEEAAKTKHKITTPEFIEASKSKAAAIELLKMFKAPEFVQQAEIQGRWI
ncbi:hypothetical protein SLEP1_g49809 [Rubroshorea leprosula]|uniref:Uncharacterized protein n=1 Tax=Rubroshorea leprosula TaxID=152421 RepID=A0AAV5M0G6_9ROSI|nr:hypothetical protein SLEP1_g49809 [Rubroshorea leprosula]